MKKYGRYLKIIFAALLLGYIFKTNNFNLSQLHVENLNYFFLFLAVIISSFVNPLIATNRWKSFLSEMKIHENFWFLFKMQLKAQFIGLALPSTQGQDAVRMVLIGKKNVEKAGAAASTVLIERIWGFGLYLIFALVATLFAPQLPQRTYILSIIGLVTLFLVVLVFILLNRFLLTKLIQLFRNLSFLTKFFQTLQELQNSIRNFPFKKVFLKTSLLIFLFQFLTIVGVSFTFKTLNTQVPFGTHLVFYPIIAIISILPITFGGFGLREGFFAYFYPLVGVSKDISILASLLVYFLIILCPALVGGIIYLTDTLTHRQND